MLEGGPMDGEITLCWYGGAVMCVCVWASSQKILNYFSVRMLAFSTLMLLLFYTVKSKPSKNLTTIST
jgi:hypothetical protein